MLRRQVSNSRMRSLHLGDNGDEPPPVVPENIPVSPTDTNLSPCSKQLWGVRRASSTDVRLAFKPRQWVAAKSEDEESSDEEDEEDVTSDIDAGAMSPINEVKVLNCYRDDLLTIQRNVQSAQSQEMLEHQQQKSPKMMRRMALHTMQC